MSQFNYDEINNKINSIRNIAPRMVYQNKNLHDLLQKDNYVSIHMKNLQYLATEICKVKKLTLPEMMKQVFIFRKMKITILGVVHIQRIEMYIHMQHIVPDKIKYALPYQFSNLGLKHGPLITTLVGSVKSLLKTWFC